MPGAFSIWHLLVIAIVAAVLFFGWKNLPDMARSAGRSLRVFKTEIKGMGDDDKAREAHDAATETGEPKQLAPRPVAQPVQRATPAAEIVRPVATPEPARSRPRPTPSPNGRPR